MEMTSTRVVNAPPEKVWKALNDPAVLKDAIPGCESLDRKTDTEWQVVIAAKVGPVAARFNGKIGLADLAPPTSYTLKFEGQGGAAGFANGEAKVSLAPSGADGTALSYTAKAQVGGKIAQIGSRLVDGAAQKLADDFFERFSEAVAAEAGLAPAAAAPALAAKRPWVRYIAVALLVGVIAYLFSRWAR